MYPFSVPFHDLASNKNTKFNHVFGPVYKSTPRSPPAPAGVDISGRPNKMIVKRGGFDVSQKRKAPGAPDPGDLPSAKRIKKIKSISNSVSSGEEGVVIISEEMSEEVFTKVLSGSTSDFSDQGDSGDISSEMDVVSEWDSDELESTFEPRKRAKKVPVATGICMRQTPQSKLEKKMMKSVLKESIFAAKLPSATKFKITRDKKHHVNKEGGLMHLISDKTKSEKKIIPKDFQKSHIDDILKNIYPKSKFGISASPAGSGKTYVGMKMFQILKERGRVKKLLIVAPKMALMTWLGLTNEYNVSNVLFIGYDGLSGTSARDLREFENLDNKDVMGKWGSNPNQPLLHKKISKVLTRKNRKGEVKKTYKYKYYPSAKLLKMVEEGVLVLLDESQEVKNKKSRRSAATMALMNSVTQDDKSDSFLMTLTATPYDKESHTENYLRMFGIITHQKKWTNRKGVIKLKALQELIDFCRKIDQRATDAVFSEYFEWDNMTINESVSNLFMFDLHVKVIVKAFSRTMKIPDEETTKHKHIIAKLFMNIENFDSEDPEEDSYIDYVQALDKLEGAYMGYLDKVAGKRNNMALQSEFNNAIHISERAKLPGMVKEAKRLLETFDKDKVIFYLESLTNVELAKQKMEKYKPLVLTGEVPFFDRLKRIEAFQKDDKYRFLVAITKTGKASISLHDIIGGRRRHTFATATHFYINGAQLAKRTNRVGVKSDSFVYFVYGKYYVVEEGSKKIYRPTKERVEETKHDLESGERIYGMESHILESITKKENVTLKQLDYDEIDIFNNAISKNTIVQEDPKVFPPLIEDLIGEGGYVMV